MALARDGIKRPLRGPNVNTGLPVLRLKDNPGRLPRTRRVDDDQRSACGNRRQEFVAHHLSRTDGDPLEWPNL